MYSPLAGAVFISFYTGLKFSYLAYIRGQSHVSLPFEKAHTRCHKVHGAVRVGRGYGVARAVDVAAPLPPVGVRAQAPGDEFSHINPPDIYKGFRV